MTGGWGGKRVTLKVQLPETWAGGVHTTAALPRSHPGSRARLPPPARLGLKRPLPTCLDCCIAAQTLLLSHDSPAASLSSETGKSPRNKSHPASEEEGAGTWRRGRQLPPAGGSPESRAGGRAGGCPLAAVCSKQASASPRPGLSLGSGEKAEREQLFSGSQDWAPETIPEDSGLKDSPQWG